MEYQSLMFTECGLRYQGSSIASTCVQIIFRAAPAGEHWFERGFESVARGANERARGAQPSSRVVERRPVAFSGRANLFFVVVVLVVVVVVVVARARIVECSSWAHPG